MAINLSDFFPIIRKAETKSEITKVVSLIDNLNCSGSLTATDSQWPELTSIVAEISGNIDNKESSDALQSRSM